MSLVPTTCPMFRHLVVSVSRRSLWVCVLIFNRRNVSAASRANGYNNFQLLVSCPAVEVMMLLWYYSRIVLLHIPWSGGMLVHWVLAEIILQTQTFAWIHNMAPLPLQHSLSGNCRKVRKRSADQRIKCAGRAHEDSSVYIYIYIYTHTYLISRKTHQSRGL